MNGAIDISELISAFRRRAWVLVASIVVITPIVLLTALLLPPYYSSTAQILVQTQQIPTELVRSTVEVGSAERLALIRQRLTTRANLLDMAERMELFNGRERMSPTEIVETLRDSIDVQEVGLSSGGKKKRRASKNATVTAFTVTYTARNPVVAARVANELVTMVLQENVESRSQRASSTRDFLKKKKEDIALALTQAEAAIADFKAENAGSLPDTLGGRQSELLALQQRVFQLENDRVKKEETSNALRKAIEQGHAMGPGASQLYPEERQLQTLRQQLAQARGTFSDEHPGIRRIRASIASLEAAVNARARKAAKGLDDAASAAENARASDLRNQLLVSDRQLGLLNEQIDGLKKRMDTLRVSIAATPDVEIALASLIRRSSELENQLQDATRKEAAAADGEELEINRQAERLEILEQAQVPEEPDSPPRKLISIAGFGGSIVVGFALIVLLELLNRTIRTTRGLVAQVGVTPIVAIPRIRTAQETSKRRFASGLYVLLLICLGAGFLVLIDLYVAPLERLVTNLMDDANLTPIVEQARDKMGGILEKAEVFVRGLLSSDV